LFIVQRQHFAVGIGWATRPGWLEPLLTFWNFSFAYTGELSPIKVLGFIVMLVGLGLGLRLIVKQSPYAGLLILWLFMPPLMTILLSYRTISFYVDRYLLVISPILTLLVIAGLFSISLLWGRWLALSIFLGVTGWGLWQVYFDRENFSKEDWRTIAQQLDASAQSGEVVVTCTDGHQLSFDYYNPQQNLPTTNVVSVSGLSKMRLASPSAWILNMNDGLPVHYLGKSSPSILDKALLPPDVATWEEQHRRNLITVPGITAYQYELTDPAEFSKVAIWHCQN
jgi:hypothetical protein